ncbi:MAG: Uma2 family endonuclease [Okeania sp. SIO3B5]|uniref:Uma2 family endonuclease n=1 Tax=Okeania sp. SIO3B5 TaxID=2607811 RepID=UPI001401A73B|nr:Uma2 family endonuclease [Okeania sp. SIO3B5]NEO51851.1 Uma2 family endonuclease [Okeania sp. SIO3B5]
MVTTNLVQTIAVNIPKEINLKITHEQFVELALVNRDLQLERTAKGELIVMAPTGSGTGNRNSSITGQLWLWNYQTKLGKTFDSSSGFHLPNGSSRSPDAAWVKQERWDSLTREQKETFAPLCPDFVIELRSKNDTISELQKKMKEYQSNGAKLGWLIDSKNRQVEIYRQNRDVEILENPNSLSGEDVLPGFVLDLTEVWG